MTAVNIHNLACRYFYEKKIMDTRFIPGDKVRLASGGPDMTIRGPHYDVLANEYSKIMLDCIWFAKNKDGKEEVHYCPFNSAELVKVKNA